MKLTDTQISTLARIATQYGFRYYIKSGKFYIVKDQVRMPFKYSNKHYEVKTIRDINEVAGL
jgi:hypothetical protein